MSTANTPGDERLVTVASFENLGELAVAKSLLEASEIDCFVRNEHTHRIGGPFSSAIGVHAAELQVRQRDAEDALAILNSRIQGVDPEKDESGL